MSSSFFTLLACGEPSSGDVWQQTAGELLAAECQDAVAPSSAEVEASPCGAVVFRRVGFANPDFDIVVDLEAGSIQGSGGIPGDFAVESYVLNASVLLTADEVATIQSGLEEMVVGRQDGDCDPDIVADGDRHELVLGEVSFRSMNCKDVLLDELDTFDAVLEIFVAHAELVPAE